MTALIKPPEPTPDIKPVKFMSSYTNPRAFECWIGHVSRPVFIGTVRRLAQHDWRNSQFPDRRFRSRLMAGRALL